MPRGDVEDEAARLPAGPPGWDAAAVQAEQDQLAAAQRDVEDDVLLAGAAAQVPRGGTVRRAVRVIARGVRQEPWVFLAAVLGSSVYGAGTAGSGWVLGRVTDSVLTPAFRAGSVTGGQLARAGGALAAVALVTAAGVVVRRVAAGVTMYRLQARYRRAVTRQYLRLPIAWHHRHPAGQLLSNANADVEAIWQVLAPLPMSLGVGVMILVSAVAMVAADPVLAGIGLLVLPAMVWLNAVYSRRMSPRVMRAQALRSDVSTVAHESFEGALVVKTLGQEATETRRFGLVAEELRDANVAVGRLRGAFDPVMEALPTMATLAVLLVGTVRVASGAIQTGDVVQVSYLLTLLAFPVRALGWVLGELPRTVVGWERVSAVLKAQDRMTHGTVDLPRAASGTGLRLDGVDFAYRDADGALLPALHDVSFEVAPGRTVAVVGATGSGKSTVATLLVRLVDPDTGTVLVDGADLRELSEGALPQVASLVPQASFVFDDTVRENVRLGADLDDERIWAALAAAQADRFVSRLPHGLDTRVGEQGTSLSGGQRQRLALARAVARRPGLLVLDDATSAVDPSVEAAILAALRPAGSRVTVVVIAHRLATIQLADEVVHVERGRVVARGTHRDLLARSAGYRDLVNAYAQDAQDRARTVTA